MEAEEIKTYTEMDEKIIGLLKMQETNISLYAAKRIMELEQQVKNICVKPDAEDSEILSDGAVKFFEWRMKEDDWFFDTNDSLWTKYGWRSRTTQQLFEYWLKYRGYGL